MAGWQAYRMAARIRFAREAAATAALRCCRRRRRPLEASFQSGGDRAGTDLDEHVTCGFSEAPDNATRRTARSSESVVRTEFWISSLRSYVILGQPARVLAEVSRSDFMTQVPRRAVSWPAYFEPHLLRKNIFFFGAEVLLANRLYSPPVHEENSPRREKVQPSS